MKSTDTTKLIEIFTNIFPSLDSKNFDFQKNRADFENWDSLTHMQLVSEIESAFKISFDMDEIVDINSPQDLVVLIEKKTHA